MRTYLCAATVICEVFRIVDSPPFDVGWPAKGCMLYMVLSFVSCFYSLAKSGYEKRDVLTLSRMND